MCLRDGQMAAPSDALDSVVPYCATPGCDCSNLGADWRCDAPPTPDKMFNCNTVDGQRTFNSACRRLCLTDAECDAEFVSAAAGAACAAFYERCGTPGGPDCGGAENPCIYKCLSQMDDHTQTGCVLRPATAACPDSGALEGAMRLGAGTFCASGDPCDATRDPATGEPKGLCADGSECAASPASWLTPTTARTYIQCAGIVGTEPRFGPTLEQPLNALVHALSDSDGKPNRAQARAFLRPDAYLALVVLTDEDDCSMNACGVDPEDGVWKCGFAFRGEQYPVCSCLDDATAGGELLPVNTAVNQIKALKADPGRVLVAAIVGDSTATDPEQKSEERELYRQSKCSECANPADEHASLTRTYACSGGSGKADYASRIIQFVEAFGQNGVVANICEPAAIASAVDTIAQRLVSLTKP